MITRYYLNEGGDFIFSDFLNFYDAGYKKKYSADLANRMEFRQQFFKLLNTALTLYEWEGLPDTCDARQLELNALMTGQLLIVNDENYGMITPIPGVTGPLNINGDPTVITIATKGGDTESLRLTGKEYIAYVHGADNEKARAVWVRDNPTMFPYVTYIFEYASKIADLERTQDVTVNRLKTPWIIKCPASMVDTIEKMFTDIDINKQAIIAANLNEVQNIDLFSTGVNPSVLGELREHRDETERKFREIFGITSNSMTDKRERLSVPEVTANSDITNISTDIRLSMRKQFADWCNNHFGTAIKVKRRGENDMAVVSNRGERETTTDITGGSE